MNEVAALWNQACVVLKEAGAREVYAFASVTRPDFQSGYDVDLGVRGLPTELFFRAAARVAEALNRKVDLVDLDRQNPFTDHLRGSGELVCVG